MNFPPYLRSSDLIMTSDFSLRTVALVECDANIWFLYLVLCAGWGFEQSGPLTVAARLHCFVCRRASEASAAHAPAQTPQAFSLLVRPSDITATAAERVLHNEVGCMAPPWPLNAGALGGVHAAADENDSVFVCEKDASAQCVLRAKGERRDNTARKSNYLWLNQPLDHHDSSRRLAPSSHQPSSAFKSSGRHALNCGNAAEGTQRCPGPQWMSASLLRCLCCCCLATRLRVLRGVCVC